MVGDEIDVLQSIIVDIVVVENNEFPGFFNGVFKWILVCSFGTKVKSVSVVVSFFLTFLGPQDIASVKKAIQVNFINAQFYASIYGIL